MSDNKEHFLAEVIRHITSKEAKSLVRKELSYHLQQSKNALLAAGAGIEEADRKAVEQMGSPDELGRQLDKLHRPKIDWWLIGLFAAVLGLGFLPLRGMHELPQYYVGRQAVHAGIGAIIAIAIMFSDYRKLERHRWLFFGTGVLLLLMLNFSPTGMVNGMPLLSIAGLSISSLTSLPFLLIFWVSYLAKDRPSLWVTVAAYLSTALLLWNIPALPVVFMYSLVVLALFWKSAIKRSVIYATTAAGASLAALFGVLLLSMGEEYQKARLLAFFTPEKYAKESGYMYLKVKELLSGGGWFGQGGIPPAPDLATDLALVNVAYQYGWLAAGILALVLAFITARMLSISRKVKDRFAKQVVTGVTALFSVQFIYNVGMLLGFLPLLSISLPFISFGLMPMVLNSMLIGLVLSVYRRKDLPSTGIANH